MHSISIMNKSKTRPLSKLELSLQPKPFSCRLTDSKRKSLRQSIYQKLVWREKGNMTEVLAKRRFGMLTVRPYCIFESNGSGDELICPPAEICTYVMSLNEGIIDNKRILIRHDYPTNHQFCQFSRISENSFSELSQPPNHINIHHACLRIANEMRGCWANLILVPASQYQHLAASLVWIKQKRDTALKRDTVSIRAERLICMEDMIAVIGRLVETDVDDSSRWEQNISSNLSYACDLHAAAPSKCPMVIGKSACQHFLDILRNLVNCNYRAREECIFEIDNAKRYKNSIARPVCHNRINPFQITSRRDPKDNHITNDEPFSLIRLRTPEKMQYVTKWLNSLDLSAQMLETFTGNFQKELLNLDGPSRQC
uniref:Mab-21 domain-containing protein n=1 Tax=Elaeophora elaphi TaxID=1147741 RepID=A0A0R3RVG0_9BILA